MSEQKTNRSGNLPNGQESALQRVAAHGVAVARALKWHRQACATIGQQVRTPAEAAAEIGFHGDLDLPDTPPDTLAKVLEELPRLHTALVELGRLLSDPALRKLLADANADGVKYAGEVAPSYAEAVYMAGERRLQVVKSLCAHGVEVLYMSRLRPGVDGVLLGKPWRGIPSADKVVFNRQHGGCLRSSEMLVARICEVVREAPEIDDDQARVVLEKETGRASRSTGTGRGQIPMEHRSKAISKRRAAELLGRPNQDSGVKWLNDCIADGTISCEQLTRQSFVFDKRQFPSKAQGHL